MDRDVLLSRIDREHPKATTIIGDLVKSFGDLSIPNVVKEVCEFKKHQTSLELSSALLAGNDTKTRDLIELWEGYDQGYLEATDEAGEIYQGLDVEELINPSLKENLIKLYPRSLNDKLEGGVPRGTSIAIYARPECIGGDAKLDVIRGQGAYDSNRSSCKYTLAQLHKTFHKNTYPTWIKSVNTETDKVLYRKVKDIWATGKKSVYRLVTLNSSLHVTPEHLVYTTMGWLSAQYLKKGDFVARHDRVPFIRTGNLAKDHRKEYCTKLPHSPYRTRVISGHLYHRVSYHRAAYDAWLNNLAVEDLLTELRENVQHELIFSDPNMDVHHVHHVDNDPTNDDPSNLLLLSRADHSKLHGANQHFGQNQIVWDEVVTIVEAGQMECYDIEMETYPNFIVNDLVVHNCGKSLMAINMVAGFCRDGHKTLYVGNEDPASQMLLRFICRMSGMNKYQVIKAPAEAQRKAQEKGYGNLIFASLSPGTMKEIENLIIKYKPEILVVDQIRNINVGADGLVQQLEKAASRIRTLGKKYNLVTVQVTQAGESATNKLVLAMNDVDNSKTGFQAAFDLMIGLGAATDLDSDNKRVISLTKNKITADHSYFPVTIDKAISKVGSL